MSRQRSAVSLLVAFSFIVLAVTGVLAFILPFSIRIIGLHALIGFGFVGLIAFHVFNNFRQLSSYLRSRVVWGTLVATIILVAVFLWQPAPVRKVLRLSGNLGPALDRFEVTDEGMRYQYVPDPRYRMALNVRRGSAFDGSNPPDFAIWLENASHYHIKTLHTPQSPTSASATLPYWDFKRRGWEVRTMNPSLRRVTLKISLCDWRFFFRMAKRREKRLGSTRKLTRATVNMDFLIFIRRVGISRQHRT